MKRVTNLGLLILFITVLGCATTTPQLTPAQVSAPETWGAATNITRLRHLYFSEQPDEETLAIAKERAIEVVINLREQSEYDWDEEGAAKSLGLTYYNVPIAKQGPFSPAAIQQIDALVASHAGDQILIHCSSGNRAAGWLAIHLVAAHDLQTSAALDIARKAGITKDAISAKVQRYVAEHITEAGMEGTADSAADY